MHFCPAEVAAIVAAMPFLTCCAAYLRRCFTRRST